MRTYIFLLLSLTLCAVSSCAGSKKQEMSPELIKIVSQMQDRLPLSLTDGLLLTKIEYKDTILTLENTIDEKRFPFENLVKVKHKRKYLLLTNISVSKQDERKLYEQCVFYNVSLKYHFIGKSSYKEMALIVAPKEIEQALNHKSSTLEILKTLIEGDKATLPIKIDDGMVMTNIELRDSMVYVTIKIDEENYQFTKIEDNLDEIKEDIAKSMMSDPISANIFRTISNAHCGLTYSYIGSLSGKTYNIVFPPEDKLLDMTIYETK